MMNRILLGVLMMTAGDAPVGGVPAGATPAEALPDGVPAITTEPAGVINAEETMTLPDTTEGNRGPSNTTRNNGDPTKPITTPIPEVEEPEGEGQPTIGNSTNAVTDHAYNTLSPMHEVTLKITREVAKGYDVKPAFVEALGTDNVEPGPFNSAFRSIVFKYPEAHGQRACIVYKDGTLKFLASGTNYYDWYAMSREDSVACAAIVYFNQSPAADNPYVSVRWYKKDELPTVVTDGDDSL